jgi:hypothetical protein
MQRRERASATQAVSAGAARVLRKEPSFSARARRAAPAWQQRTRKRTGHITHASSVLVTAWPQYCIAAAITDRQTALPLMPAPRSPRCCRGVLGGVAAATVGQQRGA